MMEKRSGKKVLRESVPAAGSFVSMPDAFPEADNEIRNAPKMEFTTEYSSANRIQSYFSTDKLLVDLAAVDSAQINFDKMAADCDLIKDVIARFPVEIQQCLVELQSGEAASIRKVDELLNKIGLTEKRFADNGGGLLWLLLPVVIGALGSGCTGANSNKPYKKPTSPKPKPAPDAGPSDGGVPP